MFWIVLLDILVAFCINQFFSSSEPKAQVRFSNQNVSIVCRRCRLRSSRKLLIFSSYSPDTLGWFQ